MISSFAFLTTTISTIFHVAMGLVYFTLPSLREAIYRDESLAILDPCGFLTFPYYLSDSVPSVIVYATDPTTRVFLRCIGVFMLTGGLYFYYETIFNFKIQLHNAFGLLHFYYMFLCMGGFRNHWGTVDYLWSWFFFHLILAISLMKLKRIKVADAYEDEDTDDDEDYTPEYTTSSSSDEEYYVEHPKQE